MAFLGDLRKQLRISGVLDQRKPVTIINARVPIIKCSIWPPGVSTSLRADISLGVSNGVKAVDRIKGYMKEMPPVKPLVLVLKSLLKEKLLHEVHTGGLSSYSLVNMVIAHLMAEGYSIDQGKAVQDREEPPNQDLGHLLWGFFSRFGTVFDYYDQAVSVLQGGVIRKKSQWRVRFKAHLLAIEDPEQPGKDISAGSFNIQRVKALFEESADRIDKAVASVKQNSEQTQEAANWQAIQSEGMHQSVEHRPISILGSVLNLDRALRQH